MSVRTRPSWPGDAIARKAHQAWYAGGREGKQPKICRLCGRDGLPSRRHSWHPRCAAVIQPAIFPRSAIRWTVRRQRGTCATCPEVLAKRRESEGEWERRTYGAVYWELLPRAVELDHVVPLWRVAMLAPERQTLRWWLPGNLQALCVPCHRAKTKLEAAERAEMRSPQRSLFPIAEVVA